MLLRRIIFSAMKPVDEPIETIYIVSHSHADIIQLKSILEENHKIVTVDRPDVASLAKAHAPDLIIMEMTPHVRNIYDELQRLAVDIPLIFIKDKEDYLGLNRLNNDCVDVISRPLLADEVRLRVGAQLTMKRQKDVIEEYVGRLAQRVTDLSTSKQDVEQAIKQKTNFLSDVSHELRTPLNGIVGFSELIMATDSIQEAKMYAGLIISESEMLLDMINELLESAKKETGKITPDYLPFDLSRILHGIMALMDVKAKKKGVTFQFDIDRHTPLRLMGDPKRLRQIIVNLVGNAVKFTEKGTINMAIRLLEETKQQVRLSFEVRDTGIGIAKERQAAIFDRFVQADPEIHRTFGGTGLGTSIAKHFVETMGGTLCVESELGKGSCFHFSLTFDKRYPETHGSDMEKDIDFSCFRGEDSDKSFRHGTILLVDDYQVNRTIAAKHLENAGYSVEMANNGKEAVALCIDKKFDLILMDIQMPEMDGFDATRTIRAGRTKNTSTQIIGISGNVYPQDNDDCIKAGMNAVLAKPFRRVELLTMVNKWMANH